MKIQIFLKLCVSKNSDIPFIYRTEKQELIFLVQSTSAKENLINLIPFTTTIILEQVYYQI